MTSEEDSGRDGSHVPGQGGVAARSDKESVHQLFCCIMCKQQVGSATIHNAVQYGDLHMQGRIAKRSQQCDFMSSVL